MKAPYFWSAGLDPQSREAAPLTRFCLTPAAWIYAYMTRRRLQRMPARRTRAKVICVGNLTAGGTGKSPVVAYIRSYLQTSQCLRTASLSRGYGGRLKSPVRVCPEQHTAREVGDEPLMLARSGESWIGRNRGLAGEYMDRAGVQVIVMDDGYQNPGLTKDLSLIVIDAQAGFGNGYVIPKGPLREPVKAGLVRADAVILVGEGAAPEALKHTDLPIFRARLEPVMAPPEGPLIAFAGIGRPEKFFDGLLASNAQLCDTIPFPDHHVFSDQDLRYLTRLARDHKARLITTEKDYVRLTPHQKQDVLFFPVEIKFEKADIFHNLLDQTIAP